VFFRLRSLLREHLLLLYLLQLCCVEIYKSIKALVTCLWGSWPLVLEAMPLFWFFFGD